MRFNNLTVARFAAAFLVFLHHSSPVEYDAVASPFWKNVYANGFVGVSFFFVVSGFVLAASSLQSMERLTVRGATTFWWKRIARIVPLWLLVSLPWIIKAVGDHDPALWPFLTFTQAWNVDAMVAFGLLGVSWTLSVEMLFYLLFPFVAAALRPFRSAATGPVLVAIGLAIPIAGAFYYACHEDLAALLFVDPDSAHRWLYRYPPARFGEFLAGIGLFLTLQRGGFPRMAVATWTWGVAATAALIVTMGLMPVGHAFWVAPYAVLFTVIVLMLARLDVLGFTVRNPRLLVLGEASFAFYLVHQYFFKAALLPPLTALFGLPVSQVAVLLLAVATSIGLYTAVEVPMRLWLVKPLTRRKAAERDAEVLAPG